MKAGCVDSALPLGDIPRAITAVRGVTFLPATKHGQPNHRKNEEQADHVFWVVCG